jgi:hypothetical protein
MIQKVNQLEILLKSIDKEIENRIKAENVDIEEIDAMLLTLNSIEDQELKLVTKNFREIVIKYLDDKSFMNVTIPTLIKLLESSLEKLNLISKITKDIGGKDLPNKDIVDIIKTNILNETIRVFKNIGGKEVYGNLTKDGFIEIYIDGIKVKKSLRKAAIAAFGRDISNQWDFWNVVDNDGEIRSLEYYRSKLENPRDLHP